MPELPEVENLRLMLSPILVGQTFQKVEMQRRDLRFPFPKNFETRIYSSTILKISRRAKYLMFHLNSGEILVFHFGMSGRLLLGSDNNKSNASNIYGTLGQYKLEAGQHPQHDHLILFTKSGLKITYNDQRRFGYIQLIKEGTLKKHPLFKNLGIEPLSTEFNNSYLARHSVGRKSDLKSFLMDQHHIVGLGNIYVCEALFRAGLSPMRRTGTIVDRNLELKVIARGLVSAIRDVLKEAINAGGTTLRDYLKPDGSKGEYKNNHRVYDRENKICVRLGCSGIIQRVKHKGRSTFYCPQCQR